LANFKILGKIKSGSKIMAGKIGEIRQVRGMPSTPKSARQKTMKAFRPKIHQSTQKSKKTMKGVYLYIPHNNLRIWQISKNLPVSKKP